MSMYYKVLERDGSARRGQGKWHLPLGNDPGEWMPPIEGELVPCENGYHLCRESDLLMWLGPAIFEAEYRGEKQEAEHKMVVREARLLRHLDAWNERTARLFAADCAEHVLPIFETRYPYDDRPRKAIEAARAAAAADASYAAARADASYAAAAASAAAATDAAAAAATAASYAADASYAASYAAARAAADAASYARADASYAAARDAAYADESAWQTWRLMQYLDGSEND